MLTVHSSNVLYACHVLCSSCDSEFVSGAHIPIAVANMKMIYLHKQVHKVYSLSGQVNDEDVSTATHDQAIRLLKISPDPLTLLVRHEPPPPGLLELTLVTKPGEGFGFSISGGVNGYPGNPLDETDEGIFISEVSFL